MPSDNYTARVVMLDDMREFIQRAAAEQGVSAAEFIRRLIEADAAKKGEVLQPMPAHGGKRQSKTEQN